MNRGLSLRSLTILVSVLVILSLVLTACGGTPTPAPTAVPTVKPAEPTKAPVVPTAAPTKAPAAPTVAVPAPKCDLLPNMPTVKAGDLGSKEKPIVITFVPSGDVPTLTKAGNEMADCLSKLTGLSYKIEVGTSYAASIEAVGAGKAQVSFLATFAIILAREKYGIEPVLVSLRTYKGKLENFYQGQFIANKKSGIKTLADLKGKTFCFVDPTSTSGSIIPQIVMKANGINPDKDLKATQNAGSHDNVAIAVYKGDCDAGATFVDVRTDSEPIKKSYPDILDKVDQFYITQNIPNDGMQVAKDLDAKLKQASVDGMMAIAKDTGGAAMLKRLYSYGGLDKISANFYDDFRDLLKKAGVDAASMVK